MEIKNEDNVREWLNKHCHRVYTENRNPYEFNHLLTLLKQHPNYKNWKRKEPNSFKITRSRGNKALQLMVRFPTVNTIGKYRIVSWRACANKKLNKSQSSAEKDRLNSAMRYAVRVQMSKFRKSFGIQKCAVCENMNRIEVDHYPKKFVDIKNEFIQKQTIKNNPTPQDFLYHYKRGISMFKKEDIKWKQAWQRYHNSQATYRFLCSTCNKKY